MIIIKSILSRNVKALPKLLLLPVMLLAALFSKATITIATFPYTDGVIEICDVSPSTFLMPVTATTNCGASSSAINFQWYLNGTTLGTTGAGYNSAATATLSVTSHTAMGLSNGDVLRVILTETGTGCTDIDTLDWTVRLVATAPVVSLTGDQTLCDGETVDWDVDVTSPTPTGGLLFEWYRRPDGGAFPGTPNLAQTRGSGAATIDTTYSFVTDLSLDQEDIKVEVTNICGTTISSISTLNMVPIPNLTPGADITVCEGASAGTGISYIVFNTAYDPSTGGSASWATSVTVTGSDAPSVAALTGLFSGGNLTGTGNGSKALVLPALNPGTYEVTFNSINETNAPSPPTCTRTLTNQKIDITVYPDPTVSWGNGPTLNLCEGTAGVIDMDIDNAEYGTGPTGIDWQVTFTQSSGNVSSGCGAGSTNGGILPGSATGGTFSGNGNHSEPFAIATTLEPGIYTYTLTTITNTSNSCTSGSPVTGPATFTVNIYPEPDLVVTPVTSSVCDGTAGSFTVAVSNTAYCSALGTSASSDWSAPYTDATGSTLPGSPLTGTGDLAATTYTTSAATGAGTFLTSFTSIDNTTAGTAGATCGPVTLTADNEFTLTVNPEPTVTSFTASSATICEGTSGETVDLVIANAAIGGSPQNWQVTFTDKSGAITTSCVASTYAANMFPSPWNGSGNGTESYSIPNTLPVGEYEFEITNVQNTSAPGAGCTVGAVSHTATFEIYPVADITFSPNTKEKCESDAGETFQYTVSGNQRCLGNTPTDISSTFTVVDNITGGGLTSLTQVGNTGAAISLGVDATLAVGNHTFTATAVNSGAGTCTEVISEVMTLTVEPRPEAYFDTENVYVCEGSGSTFDINIENDMLLGSGVNWSIDYTEASGLESSACASGSVTANIIGGTSGRITGTGSVAALAQTVTVPTTLAPGLYTYTLTKVTNEDGPCTGTLPTGAGQFTTVNVFVYQNPDVSITPARDSVCEGSSATFSLTVDDIEYCATLGAGTTDAAWEFDFSDAVASDISTVAGLTVVGTTASGTGNGPFTITANDALGLTEGIYEFEVTSVETTGLPGTNCSSTISETYQLDVHPTPEVSWNGVTSYSVCEGETDDIEIEVENAMFDGNPINWSITMTESSGNIGTGCLTGATAGMTTMSPTITGNGNKTGGTVLTYAIPTNLTAGIYTFTLASITNTQNGCAGSVTGTSTVTVQVKPKPEVTITPSRDSTCETATSTFDINISNIAYCTNLTGTSANADYDFDFTDNVNSNIAGVAGLTVVGTTASGSTSGAFTVTANSPSLGEGVYTFDISSIETTNFAANCTRTVTASHQLDVHPEPEVSWDGTTSYSVCEGESGTVTMEIENAVFNTADVAWTVTLTESSGNLTTACNSGATAGIFGATVTGTGNKTGASVLSFTIPNTLEAGIYTYTLTGITNNTNGCTGTITGGATVSIYVNPQPDVTLSPASAIICQGNNTTDFTLTVTNAEYCTAVGAATGNADWSINITDNVESNIVSNPLTNSGNGTVTVTANSLTPPGLAAGVYTFTMDDIQNVQTAPFGCASAKTLTTSNEFELTVNAAPEIEFDQTLVTLCEGDLDSFTYTVTNAAGVAWSSTVTENSGNVSSACATGATAGILSSPITGTGNVAAKKEYIPTTLEPGYYTYTLSGISNTTASPACPGTIGVNNTITIEVYPKPSVSITPGTLTVCENTQANFSLDVTGAQYCPSVGGALTNVAWTLTRSSNSANSNLPATVSSSGNQSYTHSVNNGLLLTAGTYDVNVSDIVNTTHSCTRTLTGTELTVTVDDLPTLVINSPSSGVEVCTGNTLDFSYTVSDVELTDAWSFTYNTTFGGVQTVTGTGPTTATFTTPAFATSGAKTMTFTAIVNTTTSCVNNTAVPNMTINVLPLPDVSTMSILGSSDICSNTDLDVSVTVTNSAGKNWAITYQIDDTTRTSTGTNTFTGTWTGTSNGTFTFTIPTQYWLDATGVKDTRTITLTNIVWTGVSPTCPNTPSPVPASLVYDVFPLPKVVIDADDRVCINEDATVRYTVSEVNATELWQFTWSSTSPADGPNTESGTGSLSDSFNTVSLNPVGNSIVSLGSITNTTTGCAAIILPADTVIIDPPSIAGTLSPSMIVCEDDNGPFTVTLVGKQGDVVAWDSSANNNYGPWHLIASTDTFRTFTNPNSEDWHYRVRVKQGACDADTSNDVRIQVNEKPTYGMNAATNSICVGGDVVFTLGVTSSDTFTIAYDYTGPSSATGMVTGSGTGIYTETLSGLAAGTYTFNFKSITNNVTGCDTTYTISETVVITPVPTAGTISPATATLCSGSNANVTWTPGTGSVDRWEVSTDQGNTWATLSGAATASLSYSNVTDTTWIRAVIKNAPCTGEVTTSIAKFNVLSANPLAEFTGLNSSYIYCEGSAAPTISSIKVSGTGSARWEITISEGSTNNITLSGLNDSTFDYTPSHAMDQNFDVVIQKIELTSGSAVCEKFLGNTSTVEIEIIEDATASLNVVPTEICENNKVTFTVAVGGGLAPSDNWTLNYTVNGVAQTAATGTGPGTFTITSTDDLTAAGGIPTSRTIALTSITNTTAMTSASTTCTVSLSGSTTILVYPESVGGTAAGTATVCVGSNSGSVSISGETGSVTGWQYSVDGGSTWIDINSSASTSYTYSNLTLTTMYRAVVKSGECASANSTAVTITMQALPTVSIDNTDPTNVCRGGDVTVDLSLGNVVSGGAGMDWTLTYTVNNVSATTTGSGSTGSFTLSGITADSEVELVSIAPNGASGMLCSNTALTDKLEIQVIDIPTVTVLDYTNPLCNGDIPTVDINVNNVGNDAFRVYYKLGSTGTTRTYDNTGDGNFTITTVDAVTNTGATTTTQTIYVDSIRNLTSTPTTGVPCTSNSAITKAITVYPTTVGGSATGTATVCYGDNSGTVGISGNVGDVAKWQYSTDGGTTWTDIFNSANSTQAYSNLTVATMYRAVVQSGPCATANSAAVTISIQALPVATITNTDPTNVCYDGTVEVGIAVADVVSGGSGMDWTLTYTVNNVTATTTGTGATGSFTLSNILVDSEVELVSIVPNGAAGMMCSNLNLSDKLEIVVIETPNVTVLDYSDTLCTGGIPSIDVSVNSIGTSDNFRIYYKLTSTGTTRTYNGTGSGNHTITTVDAVSNTGTTITTQTIYIDSIRNLSTTPTVGVACTNSLGITEGITVYPTTVGGSATGTATVCYGDNSGTVGISGKVGDVTKWQYSTDGGTTWTDIFNSANSTQAYSNLTVATMYRAVVQSGPCTEANSAAVTISIQALPVATITNTDPTNVCYDGTVEVGIAVADVVSGGSGMDWTLTYTVNNVTAATTGTGATGSFTLSNILVDSEVELVSIVPNGAAGMMCSNLNLSDKLEIVVIETPNVTVLDYSDTLCTGEIPSIDVSVNSIGTSDNFRIYYKLTSTGTTRTYNGTGSGNHTITTVDAVSNTGATATTQTIYIDSIRNLSTTPTVGVACTNNLGITEGITVYPATVGGDATGTATVCNGFNQGTVTITNNVGDVVKWQYRVGTGAWTDIFNSDTTDYVYTNLAVETEFRAVVQSGPCSVANSSPVTISIQPLPIVTINNVDPTNVCKGGEIELSFEVSNVANGGSGEDWTITYDINNVATTLTGTGNGTKTVTLAAINLDTEVELIKIESRGVNGMQCDNLDLTDKLQVKIIENPILTITDHSDTLCNGSTPTVDVNISGISSSDRFRVFYKLGATGATRTYEQKGPGNYTISSVDKAVNTGTTIITETIYIDSVRNIDAIPSAGDLCTGLLGYTRDIRIFPISIGGDAIGDATVCKDENSGWVSVINKVGEVVKWQYKEVGGAWTDIFNTDTIAIMYENLSVETRYRAIVQSGPCTEATSTDALIEIQEVPEVEITNVDPTYVCDGGSISLAVTVTKVAAGATGTDWTINYTINGVSASFDGSGNGSASTTISNITADAEIELVSIVARGANGMKCNNRMLSDKLEVKTIENPLATISSVESPVCSGTTVDFKVDISNVGTSESWSMVYKLGATGTNRTVTGTGSGVFTFTTTDLVSNTGTTFNTTDVVLVSIENTTNQPTSGGNCNSSLSDTETVTVYPETVGGTTAGTATVCNGDNFGWITLSGQVGDVVKWQSSTNGTTWSDIASTNDSISYSNITAATTYRAVVMSGPCAEANSSEVTISIQELPTATILNNTFNVCEGSNATINYTVGNVGATQSWTIGYKVNGTTQSTNLTGTGPGSSTNPHTLTLTALNITTDVEFVTIATTSGNPTCTNMISEKATVTVLDNPTATITAAEDSICQGSAASIVVTVDNVKVGERWVITYDDGVNTNVTKDGFGPGAFTFFTATINSGGTYDFKLKSIVNAGTTPSCATTLTGDTTIYVSPTTVGGVLSPASVSKCYGSNSGTVTWTLGVGDIVRWEISEDGGATWAVLANTGSVLSYKDLTVTTRYRVLVQSGVCAAAYSSEAVVIIYEQPVATISGSPSVCPNDPATFTLTVTNVPAGEGWEVTFVENGTTRRMTGTGSGSFTLTTLGYAYTATPTTINVSLSQIRNTATDCINADLNSSASAKVTPNPVASFDAANACQDTVVVFDNKSAIAEGAISSYRWFFGDGDSSLAVSPTHAYAAAGTYTVRLVAISDNGCTGEVSKSITIYDNPVADFDLADVCQNVDFVPTNRSTVAAGRIDSWEWSFGDLTGATGTTVKHRYGASGTYDVTLKVTTENGCTDMVTKEATIFMLPEAAFVAQPVCEDETMNFVNTSAIGNDGGMTYAWDFNADGSSDQFVTNPSHTFTGSPKFGDFNVRLIATSGDGCLDTTVRTVTVFANPIADFVVDRVCIGETSFFGNRSFVPAPSSDVLVEYFWNFADTSFSTGENPSHTYEFANENGYAVTLRVVTDKGCEDMTGKDVIVDELPTFDLTATPNPICDGDSSVIEVTNPSTTISEYTWNTGATTAAITAKTEGMYSVTVTEDITLGGCKNSDSIFLTVWPLPAVDAGRDTTIHKGQIVQLMGNPDGMSTYTWTPDNVLDLPSDQNPRTIGELLGTQEVGMTESTTFTLTVEDINGCANNDDVTVTVLDEFTLTVYNVVTPNDDGNNDTWIIENILAYPTAEVAIFNRYGMEIFNTTGYANDWNGTYEGNHLPDGAYYYVVTIADIDKVYKGAINLIRTVD